MKDLAYLEICLVVCKEFLPILYALAKVSDYYDRYRLMQWRPTLSSWSVNPRKSCVRCVAKHPVAKDLAASIPALHSSTSQKTAEKTVGQIIHAVV